MATSPREMTVESRSKARRSHDLVTPRPAVAVRAEPLPLPEDASAAAATAAILRGCLRQVEANADHLREREDAESVHQLRVGVRRLRCALAILRDLLPAEKAGELRRELRWLAGVLGRLRDLDVLRSETLPAIASGPHRSAAERARRAAALDALSAIAAARAAEARRAVDEAIASPRFAKLVRVTGRLATATPLAAVPRKPGHALLTCGARTLAGEHLRREHRKLARAARRLPGSTEDRHALRIRAKRMRYTAEFFAALYPARRARAYREALTALQQVLGEANDAATAAVVAGDLAPGSPGATLVTDWSHARTAKLLRPIERGWRRLERCERFWTGD